MAKSMLIIYRSPNGEDSWEPVKPEDVPDWVKAPDVMAHLVAGEMAQADSTLLIANELRPWYRAEQVEQASIH